MLKPEYAPPDAHQAVCIRDSDFFSRSCLHSLCFQGELLGYNDFTALQVRVYPVCTHHLQHLG